MRLRKGISLPLLVGVVEDELWNSSVHSGRFLLKKSTKCCSTAALPSVPDTRVLKIGASSAPVLMLKSSPGLGRCFRVSSLRVLYVEPRDGRRETSESRTGINMATADHIDMNNERKRSLLKQYVYRGDSSMVVRGFSEL
jgi:hypothetical protein